MRITEEFRSTLTLLLQVPYEIIFATYVGASMLGNLARTSLSLSGCLCVFLSLFIYFFIFYFFTSHFYNTHARS